MDIILKNLQTRIPIRLPNIRSTAAAALRYLGYSSAELSIVFVSPQRMKQLNAQHLHHAYVTDILTFDYRTSHQSKLHAELVICPSQAQSNAKVFGTSTAFELKLYVVHGLLHLSGYDDHDKKSIATMRRKEQEILAKLTRKT